MSPTNSMPDRLGIGRRKDVDDAAANGESAVLVDRILAGESGVDQQVGKACGSISVPGRISSDARQQPFRRADLRKQRGRRTPRSDGRSGCGGVQRAGAGGRDPEVRRHPAVRVDLQRRKRQHRPLGRRSDAPSSAA